MSDMVALIVVAAIAGAVTALALWRRPKGARLPETLVVQYDPPAGLAPAEVGTLIDGRAHDRDILAVILDLAVRGYLTIRDTGDDFEFIDRQDAPADGLKEYEDLVRRTLFSGRVTPGRTVRLSDASQARAFVGIMDDLRRALSKHLTEAGYFAVRPDAVRNRQTAIGLLVLLPASILSLLFYTLFTGDALPGTAYLIALVPGAVVAAVAHKGIVYTSKGAAAAAHAMGFRTYLAQAEKYRLEWQEKEMIFEKYLPYAAAFDVVDAWTKAFAGMATPPSGYEGDVRALGGPRYDRLSSSFTQALSAARAAIEKEAARRRARESDHDHGGSGFGRRGRSGGGFGGGGGKSW